ncbi:biotin-dependent carboxyltransferase family protein [Candidatus Pelagibacter sp. Uisw_134_02]|uniref:5-oxoprolinase subunit C family protein n=1 Tax=Candidatus Pelagibacter sp. Uisw_134_02 TaxID=3230990 RepID=UPI0039EAD490
MSNSHFEILRSGINTTIQDNGRNHMYHEGVTISGAIDQRNYKLANKLVNNELNEAVIEFAYQGPLLKLKNNKINFSITGDVLFKIIRKNLKVEEGVCYKNYILEEEDQLDIISTKNTVYGYLSVNGGFKIKRFWNSYSINTKANIGPNNGKKYSTEDKIFIKNSNLKKIKEIKLDYFKSQDNIIRVIRGTNFDYFSLKAQNQFFNQEFSVTNLADRMGIRLSGDKLENIISTNIKSEGIVRGVIQVPADGNPIIMLSDHGTIGGYPKIGVVISADLDRVGQLTPGSTVSFKEVSLEEAQNIFKAYTEDTNKYLYENN